MTLLLYSRPICFSSYMIPFFSSGVPVYRISERSSFSVEQEAKAYYDGHKTRTYYAVPLNRSRQT